MQTKEQLKPTVFAIFGGGGDLNWRILQPDLGSKAVYVKQFLPDKLLDHKKYINNYGQDMPEIRN